MAEGLLPPKTRKGKTKRYGPSQETKKEKTKTSDANLEEIKGKSRRYKKSQLPQRKEREKLFSRWESLVGREKILRTEDTHVEAEKNSSKNSRKNMRFCTVIWGVSS